MTKNIILFDGECGLCALSVQLILKHERNKSLKFASLQSSYAKSIFTEFNMSSNYDESILLYNKGMIYTKSKAILMIIPFLRWYFYPTLIFWLIPNFIRDFVYDLIARNRKRFSNVCDLPSSENSHRFLD